MRRSSHSLLHQCAPKNVFTRLRPLCLLSVVVLAVFGSSAAFAQPQQLPPVPVPPENPITEAKRILGKMLFWDEQLSSNNTTACGTCHQMRINGADPRFARNPGLDGLTGTPDDVIGSLGVIRADAQNQFDWDAVFGVDRQITPRAANSVIFAMFSHDLFWDGRATNEFHDPVTGDLLIPDRGALESQAVAPLTSAVEMAHAERDWPRITSKLATVQPMALADMLTDDMEAVLISDPSYPELFDEAFGSPEITAARIGMAIATYERTLVPDQTPWDAFIAGDFNAMTQSQRAGWNFFRTSPCMLCHTAPFFTDFSFRNVGLRPIEEDAGRFDVTGNPADRGRFKVPTLRNVGLKTTFMHNGQLSNLNEVLDFYQGVNGQVQFPENQDPLMDLINVPPAARPQLLDFLVNALRDIRVATAEFPFDQPSLHSEFGSTNPSVDGDGVPGSDGVVPMIVAVDPPNLGNANFRLGLASSGPGQEAWVVISRSDELVDGRLVPAQMHGPFATNDDHLATWTWAIPDSAQVLDDVFHAQWWVADDGVPGGYAASPVATLQVFCHRNCPCLGDFDDDAAIGVNDLLHLLAAWNVSDAGDLNDDGVTDIEDLLELLALWGGCDG